MLSTCEIKQKGNAASRTQEGRSEEARELWKRGAGQARAVKRKTNSTYVVDNVSTPARFRIYLMGM